MLSPRGSGIKLTGESLSRVNEYVVLQPCARETEREYRQHYNRQEHM
jgi:hypothetical protein